ncbi:MAG TPA: dTMP kinase [Patescibacteria group bacterium]
MKTYPVGSTLRGRRGGVFYTLEGGEGSGKSSLAKELALWLFDEFGIRPILKSEPGGTEVSEEIRKTLLKKGRKLDPMAEALLFQASRAELVSKVIKPALDNGRVVILDRYMDSSIAYQGGGRGLGVDVIHYLNDLSTQGLVPDLTFLLDIDPETGIERKNKDGSLNRLDLEKIEFHKKVRYEYLREAVQDTKGRFVVINATASPEEVLYIAKEASCQQLRQCGYIEGVRKGKER